MGEIQDSEGRTTLKQIAVVGLGLIGGSLCKAAKAHTDCRVLGWDKNEQAVQDALAQGAMDGILDDQSLGACDLLLLALYPQGTIDFIKERMGYLRPGTIAVDMAGVKTKICATLSVLCAEQGVHFIGGHPMAGIERSGFSHSFAALFNGAVMLLCRDEWTNPQALQAAGDFFTGIGFGRVKLTTPQEHDRVIAYTSQLAHIVSNAYVKSPSLTMRNGFSAGSFKDLTRVARLHAGMWTELFLENREPLLAELDMLLQNLEAYRAALQNADKETLYWLLEEGNKLKIADDAGENTVPAE